MQESLVSLIKETELNDKFGGWVYHEKNEKVNKTHKLYEELT